MIEVHLYGRLRRFAEHRDARSQSVVQVPRQAEDTIERVLERIGILREEIGSNVFLNGCYASLSSPVPDGARLGLFPVDMQLLYKWYFNPDRPGHRSEK